MLKDRTHFPPGGFKFHEARTGWSSTDHIGFSDTVLEIIRHREANKGRFDWATDYEAVATELDAYVEANLRSLYGKGADPYLLGGIASAGPPSNPLWKPLRQRAGLPKDGAAVGVINPVKKIVSGVGTLIEWLGGGLRPVNQELANTRAKTCAVCPLNQPTEGIKKAIETVGDVLHAMMSAKHDLKLTTPFDDTLESCTACLCSNKLKIWTPIEHVKSGTAKVVFEQFHPNCWVRKELKGAELIS